MNQPIQVHHSGSDNEAVMLLRSILAKQTEQNALLAAMVKRQSENVRNNTQWKKQHPGLSKRCHVAAERAGDLMNGLLEKLVTELEEMGESGEWEANYELFELIDTYGPRFQQFSMILQSLAQLSTE